ncbi:hypothetical protein BC831DRAFT_446637 [Entophlyctis helioformis]|nr:hypothetical protein BC831DRAFT_446637 [Entophlyctis helioformis]
MANSEQRDTARGPSGEDVTEGRQSVANLWQRFESEIALRSSAASSSSASSAAGGATMPPPPQQHQHQLSSSAAGLAGRSSVYARPSSVYASSAPKASPSQLSSATPSQASQAPLQPQPFRSGNGVTIDAPSVNRFRPAGAAGTAGTASASSGPKAASTASSIGAGPARSPLRPSDPAASANPSTRFGPGSLLGSAANSGAAGAHALHGQGSTAGSNSTGTESLSVSRLSRMFDAQADPGMLPSSSSSSSSYSPAGLRSAGSGSMRRDFSAPAINRRSQTLNHPPPVKPPKPAALSSAASSTNARLRSHTSPPSIARPLSSDNPFMAQEERSAGPSSAQPSSSYAPQLHAQAPSTSSLASSQDQHLSSGADRLSTATIDLENRLDSLSRLGNTFVSRAPQPATIAEQYDDAHPSTYATPAESPNGDYSPAFAPQPQLRPRPSLTSRPPIVRQNTGGSSAGDLYPPATPRTASRTSNHGSSEGHSSHTDPNSRGVHRNPSQESFATATTEMTGEDSAEKSALKRSRIAKELVDTERSFLSDMHVLAEVYAVPSLQSGVLPPADHKLLFGQLDSVIATSTEVLALFEAATEPGREDWIGNAFNQVMKLIETTYCDYCKHNEAALAKLTEYASPACPDAIKAFLEESRVKLQGRTSAWDLASMVVKPVQRVLKYPLLIRSLLKETPPTHSDFEQLVQAFEAIELVAEKINEVKKRKDIVEKYVAGKAPTNMLHGISKKLGRGAQQLKKATGLAGAEEEASDALYDALHERFHAQFESVHALQKELLAWLRTTKEYLEYEELVATCLDEVYYVDSIPAGDYTNPDRIDYPALVKKYRALCGRLLTGPYRDVETQIRSVIFPALEKLVERFREPQLVMKKRDDKLLDYERAKAIRLKGEPVDKLLADSADTYPSINAQLIEELPQFMTLVSVYINQVLMHLVDIQANLYDYIRQNIVPLTESMRISMYETTEDILQKFRDHMAMDGPVEVATRQLVLASRWRGETWGIGGDAGSDGARSSFSSPDRRNGGRPSLPGAWPATQNRVSPMPTSPLSATSPAYGPNGHLVDLSGSAPAPRKIRQYTDTDAIVRSTILVSNKTLTPVKAPLPTPGGQFVASPADMADTSVHQDYSTDPFEAVAMYAFAAEFDDELSLAVGCTVMVYQVGGRDEQTGGDWWYGEILSADAAATQDGVSVGQSGWFPFNYVERKQ